MATRTTTKKWDKTSLSAVCSIVRKSYQPVPNGLLPYVGLEHIKSGEIRVTDYGVESSVRSGKTKFSKGNILYGKLRPYLDKCALSDFEGICSTDILVLASKNRALNNYLVYLLHTRNFIDFAIQNTSGVNHPRTSWQTINKFEFDLPDLQEQGDIAQMLTAVQNAIAGQEALIAKLKELKRSMMQHLFTHGTKGEKTKMTGIGEMPESWEVVELIDVCDKPQYGFTDSASSKGNVRFLRITDITDQGVNWDKVPFCNCAQPEKYLLQDSDIVFARIGATTGKSFLLRNPDNAVYASYLIRVRAKTIDSSFLYHYFQTEAYWRQIDSQKGMNLKGGVNGSILSKLIVPKCDRTEQRRIAESLSAIDARVESTRVKLASYQSLFKTLLHELMSGERRVGTKL